MIFVKLTIVWITKTRKLILFEILLIWPKLSSYLPEVVRNSAISFMTKAIPPTKPIPNSTSLK